MLVKLDNLPGRDENKKSLKPQPRRCLFNEFREPRFHRFPAKGAFDGVEEPENWSRQPLEPT